MKTIKCIVIVLFLLLTGVSGIANNMSDGINQFTLELYKQVAADENVLLSPLSVSSAFALLYPGAGGQTKDEMSQTFYFDRNTEDFLREFSSLQDDLKVEKNRYEEEPSELSIAYSVWIRPGLRILPSYESDLEKYFDADIYNKISAAEINQWVSEKTKGKIEKIVDDISSNILMVLCNSVYFKSSWLHPFKEQNTKEEVFKISNNNSVMTDMMNIKESYFFEDFGTFKALSMEFSSRKHSMIFLLPDEGENLEAFEGKLNYNDLKRDIEKLMLNHTQKVDVKIPKFELNCNYPLNDSLIKMGIPTAFSDSADFSSITEKSELAIDEVLHKTYIKLDEQGTEAAAVTVIMMRSMGFNPEAQNEIELFHADHPFMFLIWDREAETILFIGKIVNPKN